MTARLKTVGAAIVLAGSLVLSGCGTSANTAVVVNGTSYSESDVRAAADQINANFTFQDGKVTPTAVVFQLIIAKTLADAAAKAGQPQSLGAVRSKFTKGDAPNDAALLVMQARDASAVIQGQDTAPILAELRKVNVSLNPRYGSYDKNEISIKATQPGWLAPVAAAATPTPAP